MKNVLRAALVAASIMALSACGSASPSYAEPPAPAVCQTLTQSRAVSSAAALKAGYGLIDYDGPQAVAIVARLNSMGDTDFQADHVSIVINPDSNLVFVMLADSPCGGFAHAARMTLGQFSDLYKAAIGMKA